MKIYPKLYIFYIIKLYYYKSNKNMWIHTHHVLLFVMIISYSIPILYVYQKFQTNTTLSDIICDTSCKNTILYSYIATKIKIFYTIFLVYNIFISKQILKFLIINFCSYIETKI